jgi:hypothetical protein
MPKASGGPEVQVPRQTRSKKMSKEGSLPPGRKANASDFLPDTEGFGVCNNPHRHGTPQERAARTQEFLDSTIAEDLGGGSGLGGKL